jgi:hypothetical protein
MSFATTKRGPQPFLGAIAERSAWGDTRIGEKDVASFSWSFSSQKMQNGHSAILRLMPL